jgi:hypothetical protein
LGHGCTDIRHAAAFGERVGDATVEHSDVLEVRLTCLKSAPCLDLRRYQALLSMAWDAEVFSAVPAAIRVLSRSDFCPTCRDKPSAKTVSAKSASANRISQDRRGSVAKYRMLKRETRCNTK